MKKALALVVALAAFSLTAFAADPPSLQGPVTFTAAGSVTLTTGAAYRQAFSVEVTSVTGTAALHVQASLDAITWTKLEVSDATNGARSLTMTANGLYQGQAGAGIKYLRVIASALSSGVARVILSWGDGLTVPPLYGSSSPLSVVYPKYPNTTTVTQMVATTGSANAFVYLTPSTSRQLTVSNIGTGAGTVFFQLNNSATPPSSAGTVGMVIAPNTTGVVSNPAGSYLWYRNSNVLSPTAMYDWTSPASAGTAQP